MDRQRLKIVLLAGGGGLAALAAYLGRNQLAKVGTMVIDGTKKVAFQAVIPAAARQYADAILAESAAANVNPFVTVSLGVTETGWGTAAAYKQQAGDWTMRVGKWLQAPGVRIVDTAPSGWAYPKKKDPITGALVVVPGPYAIPEDGLGWGRGLMQIDWGSWRSWLLSNDWRDPATNIRKGLAILKSGMSYLAADGVAANDIVPAALAAYNAGPGNILSAYNEIDSATGQKKGVANIDKYTMHNYAATVLGTIATLTDKFQQQTGERIA